MGLSRLGISWDSLLPLLNGNVVRHLTIKGELLGRVTDGFVASFKSNTSLEELQLSEHLSNGIRQVLLTCKRNLKMHEYLEQK